MLIKVCIRKVVLTLACTVLITATLLGATVSNKVKAAGIPDSCTPSGTTYGQDELSVFFPETTTYTIWTRLQAPSTTANSYLLDIDGTDCYNVGGDSTIPANSWDWVNDYDGNTSNIINVNLSQGMHTITLIGTDSGLEIDRLIGIPAGTGGSITCTPTNTQVSTAGDNCAPLNNTASSLPTVSITNPPNNAKVSGTTYSLNATATDSLGIASVQFQLDGSNLGPPEAVPSSGNTYTYAWDTTQLANNTTHTITAIATDTSGFTNTSSPVSVTINNGVGSSTPSTPTLSSTLTTATSVGLSWTGSTPTSGASITGYNITKNSSALLTLLSSTYTDSCLTPSTNYKYTVSATDSSGSTSTASNSLSVTTESTVGDLDGDNVVTGHDLSILLSNFGTNYPPGEFDCVTPSSTNTVEGHDLSILLTNYGK